MEEIFYVINTTTILARTYREVVELKMQSNSPPYELFAPMALTRKKLNVWKKQNQQGRVNTVILCCIPDRLGIQINELVSK